MGDGIRRGSATDVSLGHLAYWLAKRCPQISDSDCFKVLELEFPKRRKHPPLTIQAFSVYHGCADDRPERIGVKNDREGVEVLKRIDGKATTLRAVLLRVSSLAAAAFDAAASDRMARPTGKQMRVKGITPNPRQSSSATAESQLPPEAADSEYGEYRPQSGDQRPLIERQVRQRRGQQQFRDALRRRYGNRCLVTGCEVLDVLEAAHIKPYRGEEDNHPENGLLLRADIHTLFDLDLIGIQPDPLRIMLHPVLKDDDAYSALAGKDLECDGNRRPSHEALALRYEQFAEQLSRRQ